MPYILVFRGELQPGVTREQAARAIADHLGKPADRVERGLFTGKPVKVATVETKDEARRYIAIFKAAGAKLEAHLPKPHSQANSEPEATGPAAEPGDPRRSRSSGGRKFALIAAAVLCIVVIAGTAWYTIPVWKSSDASGKQLLVSNALASEDVIVLGRIDFERALQLQSRVFGARDEGALLSAGEGWDSLISAGLKPEDIEDVVVALHGDEQGSGWAAAITGQLDGDSVRKWIDSRYNVARVVGDTVYFNWVDHQTCEAVAMKAARILPDLVLVADADRIDALVARVEAEAPAGLAIDDWVTRTGTQLLTIGVLRPTGLGQAATGMAGRMLAGAGDAAQPANALYFGAEPTLVPPGVFISGTISSDDVAFLESVHSSASSWLDEARTKTADSPDVLDLVNRITFSLGQRELSAGIRLDTDFDDELQALVGGVMQRSFGVSAGASSMQDQIDENPMQFGNTTASSLPDFGQFGDAFIKPQWQEGPFALSVSRLSARDDGALEVALRVEGRGVPNAGGRARLVRMRINDVADTAGKSLLPEFECGPNISREWTDSGPAVQQSYFDDNQIAYYPYLSIDKAFTLAEETNPDEVAAIRGEIEYQMPVEVRTIRLDMPVDGEVVDVEDLRVLFRGDSDHAISYQVSGDLRRLLDVRALNANNAVLQSGSSMSSANWFGGGEDVSISIQGTIRAVELIVAEQVQTLTFDFEIPSVYPAGNDNFAVPISPLDIARPDAVAASMSLDAPGVTFDWNTPVATTTTGPAFLAINNMEATSYAGLRMAFELYVSNRMPLANHLNGVTVYFDKATLADGTSIPLKMDAQVALSPHGGYWTNGEYVADREKPWLEGGVDLQMADYDAQTPVAVEGRLIFRAPVQTFTVSLPAIPGGRISEGGIELVVTEWRPHGIEVDIIEGAERVLSILAVDAEGNPAGRATSIDGRYDGYEASIGNLQAQPKSLRVLVASESSEYEVPFSVTMPQQPALD